MEDLHAVADAYYHNGSTEQQELALKVFRAMDVDGDGRVSLQECTNFLSQLSARVRPEMYSGLDRNGDGRLDFSEFLTLFYVFMTRNVCDKCRQFLIGLYFTCVTCFDEPDSNTFDLCVNCYRGRNFSHSHDHFLDTYVLLKSKHNPQSPQQLPGNNNLAGEEEDEEVEEEKIGLGDVLHAYHAMEVALTVGTVATACTIM